MTKRKKIVFWTASFVTLSTLVTLIFVYFPHRKPIRLKGTIIAQDTDERERVPIADASVSVTSGAEIIKTNSNSSGFFTLQLPRSMRRGRAITFHFRHPNYKPLDLQEYVADKLYIAHMVALAPSAPTLAHRPAMMVANVRVRYSMKAMSAMNIGSAVKTFQVQNVGNVACEGREPCSPDGLWKAAIGSASLDAGPGNEFRNARVSCIAGPCPFTSIENRDFSKGGQKITASARDWSDTATFLLEAEVFHPMVSEIMHQSYPVIFGRALNFTLPAAAEGVCIQADIAGETIIFPLGPALFLSWANCDATGNPDQTKAYRCELKPGYQFQ